MKMLDGKISLPSSQEVRKATQRKAKRRRSKKDSGAPSYLEILEELHLVRGLIQEVLEQYQDLVNYHNERERKLNWAVDNLRRMGC